MRTAKNEAERKTISDVKNYGLHIVYVFEDEENPGFAYSVGLYENYLHPEIIIIGLKQEISHTLLNNIAYDIKNGKNFTAGEFHEGVLDDFLCYFGELPKSKYEEYVGWAMWFYKGSDFPLIQCVYPDIEGKFVWNKGFPEEAGFFCRLLIKPPAEH
ncbi:MAG TPA: DUF4262 domain-containing protein [Pyrinomonadaceae bacterium]|jgi:hypothetical protein